MILSSYPVIDLHGFDRDYAVYKVNEFIDDNLRSKKYTIVIIHGIGEGILRKAVQEFLRKNKKVESFNVDVINSGSTVVKLKEI
ncbi:MAG: Smr/MutS family protein [Bacilli bacterium]|nr:Smr/MutS family protein [Bacilli bacterium]